MAPIYWVHSQPIREAFRAVIGKLPTVSFCASEILEIMTSRTSLAVLA
jgi:hypothetical protein